MSGKKENSKSFGLIAHRRESDGTEQSLHNHLFESSELAGKFAAKVGLSEIGQLLGLLHDLGKASTAFQGYLRSKQGLVCPDEDGYVDAKRGEIDHSTAGAQLAFEKLAGKGSESKALAQFLALVIASHHSGLINCLKPDGRNEFERRITKEDSRTHLSEARSKLRDIEEKLDEMLTQPVEKRFFELLSVEMREQGGESKISLLFKHGLLARFLLSCLLDADRLSTADFEHPGNDAVRNYGRYISWDILVKRLEARYAEYARRTGQMLPGRALDVNRLRTQVAQASLDAAEKPKGIYQLTVPTGGGKTEASLRFALHHAREHKLDRIFFIVPYITIIDQNADSVRKILEQKHERGEIVLEHHSNFMPSEDNRRRHSLLTENWDAPVVFTTQVQFLEALFGSGTRDARRMHQLANSVIIFDEVQTVPVRITHMFTIALRFLTHICGATAVLCTATQPPLDDLPNKYRRLAIEPEHEIIKNAPELFDKLKRVEVQDARKPGGLSNPELADLAEQALRGKGSVLIVVNTRASAKALYEEVKGRQSGAAVYHLSTNMCPAHRMDALENIKKKLGKEPVISVSTQLIEAGVDIDFGAVIRALAGLDSITQAAGRCNRHGKREDGGGVWVVNLQEENLDRLNEIKSGGELAQTVLDDFNDLPETFGNDRIGLEAIRRYYDSYYKAHENDLDYPVTQASAFQRQDTLVNALSLNNLASSAYQAIHHAAPDIFLRHSFRSASREFQVIGSFTRGVVIPYGGGNEIITSLYSSASGFDDQAMLLKKAQRFSVNLYDHEFKKLHESGAIHEIQDTGIFCLDNEFYSDEFGWSENQVNDMAIHIE